MKRHTKHSWKCTVAEGNVLIERARKILKEPRFCGYHQLLKYEMIASLADLKQPTDQEIIDRFEEVCKHFQCPGG